MRKPRRFTGLFLLLLGMFPLLNALGNPRVATLHGSDVVGLLASGLCFGVGLTLLLRRMFRDE